MIVLGFDISSSVIGWASLSLSSEGEVSLLDYGCIKPPPSKSGTLSFRLSAAYDDIKCIISKVSPDVISIEAYANKFTKGRSSAHTIMILSVFNEIVSFCSYREFGISTKSYPVVSIRSALSKFFNKKLVSKDDTFIFIKNMFPSFRPKINRAGNIKKESYDESDAIAVALTYIIKEVLNVEDNINK